MPQKPATKTHHGSSQGLRTDWFGITPPTPPPSSSWLDDDAHATTRSCRNLYSRRLTISFFSSAIALAGFSPFGHAFVQFKIVWQR